MTQFSNVDPDKTMGVALTIEQIAKAKEHLDEHLKKGMLKEAPFKMMINGIQIISSDVVPEGTIIVPKEFADMLYTAYEESKD